MVTVLETNYQMEYSPSYTGNIHDVLSNVGFTLLHAFTNLIWRKLPVISITIQCNTVAIYCYGDGRFRLFDSHARNSSGLHILKVLVYS